MAMHGVTTDIRYIHKKQDSNYMYILYINGNTLIIAAEMPVVEGKSQKGAWTGMDRFLQQHSVIANNVRCTSKCNQVL